MKKDKDSLKNIEVLLEKLLEELIIEAVDYKDIDLSSALPIPAKIFLEMEEIIGKKIYFIGLS